MRSRIIIVVLVGLMIGLVAGKLSVPNPSTPSAATTDLIGTIWTEPRQLKDFGKLVASTRDGDQPFDLTNLKDQWTLVFYGYTSCPDVCPSTLTSLRDAIRLVRNAGRDEPAVVFISVDNERDSAQAAGAYAQFFDPAFVGISGDGPSVGSLAAQMDAAYMDTNVDGDGNYDIAHSTAIFVVDPRARLTAAFMPPHIPGALVDRLLKLRRDYAGGT